MTSSKSCIVVRPSVVSRSLPIRTVKGTSLSFCLLFFIVAPVLTLCEPSSVDNHRLQGNSFVQFEVVSASSSSTGIDNGIASHSLPGTSFDNEYEAQSKLRESSNNNNLKQNNDVVELRNNAVVQSKLDQLGPNEETSDGIIHSASLVTPSNALSPISEALLSYFAPVKSLAGLVLANSTSPTDESTTRKYFRASTPANATDQPYTPITGHGTPLPRHMRESHRIPAGSGEAIWYWCLSGLLVVFAGFASGLTVGLMSLDPVQLKVLENEGTPEQKRGIRQVSDVIRRHHLLLVTLLLANSVAMETLPIFLDRLVPSWAAVLLSVTAILLFGEIIPQAVCTGPNQLAIAQAAAPFVSLLIGLLFVISWPIAKLLDYLLGDADHHSYYARAHLKALIRMHERERRIKEATDAGAISDASSALGADEVVVIEGALDLATKTLKEIMLPIEAVFMLDINTRLNRKTFELILNSGHSRIPVYKEHRDNIKGLLLTKSLLAVDPADEIRAGDLLVTRRPIFSSPDTNLYDLLNEFQKGHSHIAFVTNQGDGYVKAFKTKTDVPSNCFLMGIATLEDVIEELIQEEIYDEFDEKALGRPTPTETPIPPTASVTSISNVLTANRKRSSHLLLLTNEATTTNPAAETFPISNFGRDLPQIVKQLSQDFSSSSDRPNVKRFGPSSAQMDSFPVSMTVPLVSSSKVPTPTSSSVIFASTSSTPSLPSKVSSLVFMDEFHRARRNPSYQRIPGEDEDGNRIPAAITATRITTRKGKSRSSTWSEDNSMTPDSQKSSHVSQHSQKPKRRHQHHRQHSSPPIDYNQRTDTSSAVNNGGNQLYNHRVGSPYLERRASMEDLFVDGSHGSLSPRTDEQSISPRDERRVGPRDDDRMTSHRDSYDRIHSARYFTPPSDGTVLPPTTASYSPTSPYIGDKNCSHCNSGSSPNSNPSSYSSVSCSSCSRTSSPEFKSTAQKLQSTQEEQQQQGQS